MAKSYDNDELDYESIRPGNIDDLFEDDDSLNINEVDVNEETTDDAEYDRSYFVDEAIVDSEEEQDDSNDESSFEEAANDEQLEEQTEINEDYPIDENISDTSNIAVEESTVGEAVEQTEENPIEESTEDYVEDETVSNIASEEPIDEESINSEEEIANEIETAVNDFYEETSIDDDEEEDSMDIEGLRIPTDDIDEIISEDDSDDVEEDIPEDEADDYKEFDVSEELINEMNSEESTESQEELSRPYVDDDPEDIPSEENHEEESVNETEVEEKPTETVVEDSHNQYDDLNKTDDGSNENLITEAITDIEKDLHDKTEKTDKELDELIKEDEFAINYDTKQFKAKCFSNEVTSIYERYTEDDLVNYINDFFHKDKKYEEYFKKIYYEKMKTYYQFVDFNDALAAAELWVLVAGTFADYIECEKHSGSIESTVEVINHCEDRNIVKDAYIVEQTKKAKADKERYERNKFDRTVFEISDIDDEDNTSIFDDKKTLEKEFTNSPFYGVLKEVLESDRMADMSGVLMKVIINETTKFIPIVDFNTGIRVVCIDTDDVNQYKMNPMLLSRNVPFSYPAVRNNVKVRMLYSDVCRDNTIPVIAALKKIVGFKQIKDKYKIQLHNNYVIAYTTDEERIKDFENGDLDAKQYASSTYTVTKPHNKSIGVIVLDKKLLKINNILDVIRLKTI